MGAVRETKQFKELYEVTYVKGYSLYEPNIQYISEHKKRSC